MSFWNKFLSFFRKEEIERRHCKGSCKHSLHIGINNYPGTANDLRGCVNDAKNWEKLLSSRYGFSTTTLLDSKATHKNVVKEIKKIVELAEKGSHIVITFSGHGTNVKDQGELDEQDKRDECICLSDSLLIDDDIRSMLNGLDKDARLTFISDSCHSGTITRSFLNTLYDKDAPKPRYMPPSDDELNFSIAPRSVSKKLMYPQEGQNHITISGCSPVEFSYDARLGSPQSFQGAMSANAIAILKKNPNCTYNEFFKALRSKLPSKKYPQSPQCEGSTKNKNRKMFS